MWDQPFHDQCCILTIKLLRYYDLAWLEQKRNIFINKKWQTACECYSFNVYNEHVLLKTKSQTCFLGHQKYSMGIFKHQLASSEKMQVNMKSSSMSNTEWLLESWSCLPVIFHLSAPILKTKIILKKSRRLHLKNVSGKQTILL